MAKDAKGHGSEARGGTMASARSVDPNRGRNTPATRAALAQAKQDYAQRHGSGGPPSYQNVSTKPLVTNAARDRLAAARSDPNHPLGALVNAVSGAIARGTATPIVEVPVHGGQPVASNAHAAATLASGGPKSAPVDVHNGMTSAQRADAAGSSNYRGSGTGPGGIGERKLTSRKV